MLCQGPRLAQQGELCQMSNLGCGCTHACMVPLASVQSNQNNIDHMHGCDERCCPAQTYITQQGVEFPIKPFDRYNVHSGDVLRFGSVPGTLQLGAPAAGGAPAPAADMNDMETQVELLDLCDSAGE